jgi:hypothetical protein
MHSNNTSPRFRRPDEVFSNDQRIKELAQNGEAGAAMWECAYNNECHRLASIDASNGRELHLIAGARPILSPQLRVAIIPSVSQSDARHSWFGTGVLCPRAFSTVEMTLGHNSCLVS